ncbi:PREDICTED: CD2 antigen cytoplasmic tail-binding protein 2 isoform X1 [Nicotiana attenuata]|nr:PREDICTED: CD2 antigen cytoplasmic tail-binding protein 2 isoform X1 [Nicotiana attenuata]
MEEGSSRRSKRPFVDVEDDDSNKAPTQKRVRFPKGKKVKQGDNTIEGREDLPGGWRDPRLAAKERSVRRNQITAELLDEENEGEIADISRAEVEYGEHETFIDDGIAIEPFNLDKEREEGYFDAAGNYVEYLNENEIKDAWLDSVDTEKRFSGKSAIRISNEDEIQDLTAEELGTMKRRIADVLEPGETVLQALRRLKGTSNNKKCKMSAETKQLFDQLTEDAMKLMENGDHNVYDEKQESFQREAEGYEKLAQARQGKSIDSMQPKPDNVLDEHFLPSGSTATAGGHSMHNADVASSNSYNSANKSDDAYDMFGEDDENVPANPASNGGDQHGDYVFDESSGYYYSSSLGHYYDPASGLYCHAASGQWYSYNDESGIYEEVPQGTSNAS